MTRFDRELRGECGEFWKKKAIQYLHKIEEEVFKGEITIDKEGVARNCIGRVVVHEVANALNYIIQDGSFRLDKTVEARDAEDTQFIKNYMAQDRNPSDEELLEMKAAFGEGATVIDVLTGKRIQL